MTLRHHLRRWHVWLGWVVALPLLLWTLSGFVMVLPPIEEVRGAGLLRPVAAVTLPTGARLPTLPPGTTALTLEPRADGVRWIVRSEAGATMVDPALGRAMPPLDAARALAEVRAR